MEEDDDQFLDGVIEFGDGRQYKISPAEAGAQNASSPGPSADTLEPNPEVVDDGKAGVSKEERFADDYDRSWPRSRPSPSVVHKDLPRAPRHPSMSPASSHPSYSPSEGSRVLFNERSNRLEPYSSHPYTRHVPGGPTSRRGSHVDHGIPPMDTRTGRDGPLRSPVQGVQLLQKPMGGYDRSSRASRSGPPPHSSFGRTRDRDGVPPPSLNTRQGWDTSDAKREIGHDGRGRRLSNMGPPPLPSTLKRDATRQLPPHISTGPPGRLFSRDSHPPQSTSVESPTSATQAGGVVAQSPLLSTISITSENPPPFAAPALTLEDAHKTAMHISAERAKQRRQLEEEEREKEKERARQKAAALEEKLRANEEKKSAQVRICNVLDMRLTYFICRRQKSYNSFKSLLKLLSLLPNQRRSFSIHLHNVRRPSDR
jgi:serine/arginine repetitive matrix protein 2